MALQYIYLLAVLNMDYYHPEDPGHVNIYFSGYRDTELEYSLPWEDAPVRLVLDGDNQRSFQLTFRLNEAQNDACVDKAIRVTSSAPVTIQLVRGKQRLTNMAAYTAIQLTPDSKDFLLSSQRDAPKKGLVGSQAVFTIGAGENQAEVRVYKTGESEALFMKTLSAYQMLEIPAGTNDLTGVYISSDEPIVVFSGHQCANVPTDIGYCEPLFQQIPALPLVGTEYVIGPIMHRGDAGYTARVVITASGTDVVLATDDASVNISYSNILGCSLNQIGDGKQIYNVQCNSPLNRGHYLEVQVTPATASLVVKCSSACYTYQLNHGGWETPYGVNTDPYMALVSPLQQKTNLVRFSTVSSFTEYAKLSLVNSVSVIAPRNKNILIDGRQLQRRMTSDTLGGSYAVGDYMVYYRQVEEGFHEVITEDGEVTNLVVQVYGHGPEAFNGQTAYGFAGSYYGPGVHDLLDTTEQFMTKSSTKPTTGSTTTVVKSSTTETIPSSSIIRNTISSTTSIVNIFVEPEQPIGEESQTGAITTGILAAVTVIVIIVVTSVIIVVIVVVVIRSRRRKAHQNGLMRTPQSSTTYINSSNSGSMMGTYVTEKCPSRPVTIIAGSVDDAVPHYCEINAKAMVTPQPPKYEDVCNGAEPEYVNKETGNDVTARPDSQPVYMDIEPDDVVVEYENVNEVTVPDSPAYEGLEVGQIAKKENTYDSLDNSKA